MKTPFIWLGSGRSKKYKVGNKGRLLDQAARAGLPVPNGGILLDEFYVIARREGVVEESGDRIVVPDSEWLHTVLQRDARFPSLPGQVAVRSAFAAEDRPDASLAGYFTTKLHVDFDDPRQMADALRAVWSSALARAGDFRRDVLVMEMVAAQTAGVAFTEAAFEDDLVNFTRGTADSLVSGAVAGEMLQIPQLRGWEAVTSDLPPFAQRLQKLLRGVRRTFGAGDWDVEWADDGAVCWLVQVRPVTRPTRRNEAFTFANLREILPDPPSPFMTSVVSAASEGFFDYYRHFDRGLPETRNMVEVFQGRPLFNVSLLTEMMRRWGLPTALVTNSLGGEGDVEVGLRWGRFFRHTFTLLRLGWWQLTAVSHARQSTQAIRSQTARLGDSFTAVTTTFRELFTQFVVEMLNLTQALSGPLLILRRTNTLAEHNARQRSIATEIYTDLAPLRDLVAAHPRWRDALAAGQAPPDPAFQAAWRRYLEKHGHRGIYESDIARPRYREAPGPLLQSLLQPDNHTPQMPPRTWLGRLTAPVWWQCSRVMHAREQWRYDAIRCYADVRAKLLELAETAVARGQLPHVEALWLLTLAEAQALDAGAVYDAAAIAQREQAFAALKQVDLPDLIRRFDDLEAYRAGSAPLGGDGRLAGVSLTTGTVNGRAWVLSEPQTQLPDGFTRAETILVARSVDPGWIAAFGLVAGVVVEIGGDLSHGSIILREIGLPAVTNVRGATRQIATGDALTLDAAAGIVRRAPLAD
jgi:rifampicin phosphotransferase